MNRIIVEVFNEETNQWEDFSSYVILPFKMANLLDEQLDECELTLNFCPTAVFEPLTKVRITIENSPPCKNFESDEDFISRADNSTEFSITEIVGPSTFKTEKTFEMIVASDNALERPVGSGKYNHELYLIELTKLLEGVVCDSLTFTNALGNNYTK